MQKQKTVHEIAELFRDCYVQTALLTQALIDNEQITTDQAEWDSLQFLAGMARGELTEFRDLCKEKKRRPKVMRPTLGPDGDLHCTSRRAFQRGG